MSVLWCKGLDRIKISCLWVRKLIMHNFWTNARPAQYLVRLLCSFGGSTQSFCLPLLTSFQRHPNPLTSKQEDRYSCSLWAQCCVFSADISFLRRQMKHLWKSLWLGIQMFVVIWCSPRFLFQYKKEEEFLFIEVLKTHGVVLRINQIQSQGSELIEVLVSSHKH